PDHQPQRARCGDTSGKAGQTGRPLLPSNGSPIENRPRTPIKPTHTIPRRIQAPVSTTSRPRPELADPAPLSPSTRLLPLLLSDRPPLPAAQKYCQECPQARRLLLAEPARSSVLIRDR